MAKKKSKKQNSTSVSASDPDSTISTTATTPIQSPSEPSIPTVYDETFRGTWYMEPSIMSMGHVTNLIGRLQYHSAQTDGSFGICVAGGTGIFISKELLDSIPEQHRPVLDTRKEGQTINLLIGGPMISIGSTFFPMVFKDADTGEKFRMVVYVIVVPKLLMGMFIGDSVRWITQREYGSGKLTFWFDFGEGRERRVEGQPF